MSAADHLDDEFDRQHPPAAGAELPPCRDTRILAWLTTLLDPDMLIQLIDNQQGGNLGDRSLRAVARQRITELKP